MESISSAFAPWRQKLSTDVDFKRVYVVKPNTVAQVSGRGSRSQHRDALYAIFRVRTRLRANGVPEAAIERHLSVIGNPEAMEAALAWYRARGVRHEPVGPTKVPTLYIWGYNDDTVGRAAAEGTGAFIDAPYRFEVLEGGGHYPADQFPDRVSALMLEHLTAHPI